MQSDDPTPTQALEPVEVTQAARDAAADLLALDLGEPLSPADKFQLEGIRSGMGDDDDGVQAFARFERDTIERHRQSSNAGGVGKPVALLHEHPADGQVEVELYHHGAGCLTDADKAAGWIETELFASLSTPTQPVDETERLREALAFVGHQATCANGHSHYCPNCDRTLHEIADTVNAALQHKGEVSRG